MQVGTDPGRAVVVQGLHEAEVAALQVLDGTRAVPPALTTESGARLVELLAGHGLLVDTADRPPLPAATRALYAADAQALLRTTSSTTRAHAALARRQSSPVLVVGRGTLPAAVADELRRAGVRRVASGSQAADDWEAAQADTGSTQAPALVVLVGVHALDTAVAHPWSAAGTPVLPVVLHGAEALVGPLVVPGGPCLRCLDLTRTDLDPAWPTVLGQLTRPAVGEHAEATGETSLVALAAAMTAMVSLCVIDGQTVPVGRSLEVSLPWPRVSQRQWPVHPRCSCVAPRASIRPVGGAAHPQARMAG